MKINPKKTTCMLLGSKHKLKVENNLCLKIGEDTIQNVNEQKLLGVIIDSTLSWESQINYVCKRVNTKIALFKKLSFYLNHEMEIMYYNAYILLSLEYCCVVWGRNKLSHIKQLTRLQKRAAKLVINSPKLQPNENIFQKLGCLSFESRCKYHTAVLVYKSMHGEAPDYLKDLLTFSPNDRYNLRSVSKMNIAQIKYNTMYKKNSFLNFSKSIWNSLPETIKFSKSVNAFK